MSIATNASRLALIAALSVGPTALLAQTATVTTPPADGTTAPADGTMAPADTTTAPADGTMAPADTTTAPADGTMAPADGTTTGAAPAAEPEVPAKPVEGQITMQGENTALASNLIGATVYSSTDESIGDINDMIVNLDGTVEGVVIGVGGFLGLGEKNVAVEMGQLTVMTDPENNETRLQTAATREDLEAAPEFVSMEDQMAAERAAQPPADTTVPADGTAPATGTAPAAPAGN